MKTCKITVLKRHFDEELAKEYGVKESENAPCIRRDRFFTLTMQNRKDFATRRGKPFTNMCLPSPTAAEVFITAIGLRSLALQSAAATTVCARSSSKLNAPVKRQSCSIHQIKIKECENSQAPNFIWKTIDKTAELSYNRYCSEGVVCTQFCVWQVNIVAETAWLT